MGPAQVGGSAAEALPLPEGERIWEGGVSREARVCVAAVLAGLVSLAIGGFARASETYDYSFSFSGTGAEALGYAAGIAVDNSTGASAHDLYVADISGHRVEKFAPSGEFILMFGDEVDATTGGDICTAASGDTCKPGSPAPPSGGDPAALSWPVFVAVDSSSGPSAGDVYVADEETLRVSKFDPTGGLLMSWGEEGHLTLSQPSGGIAVAPNGDLIVQSGRNGPATITVYDQSGAPMTSSPLAAWSGGTGIAVDGSGDFYFGSERGIEKFEPPETDLGLLDGQQGAEAVAVDLSDEELYVKHRDGHINQFDTGCALPSCTPVASFGSGYLEAYFDRLGIAVDESTHTVFATNYQYNAANEATVAVFYPPGIVPRAMTLTSGPTTESSAEIFGLVDPAGAGTVTDCYFEYVTDFNLNWRGGYRESQSIPCVPGLEYSTATQVRAALSGLEHNTAYHYRLVAANARGTSYGVSEAFKTDRALPAVATGPVVSRNQDSATVSATVGPGSGPPVGLCLFDYVSAATYAISGWASAQVATCKPAPQYSAPTSVTAELRNLNPNTTYHYRVIALNSEGQSDGEDQQFATLATPPIFTPPEKEPSEEPIPLPTGPVHCTKHPCDRTFHSSLRPARWQSPRFPVTYGWQAAVRSHGHWLPHTHLIGGCVATFKGKHLAVRVNGCHGRITLRYVGSETFTLFWQLSR